MKRLGYLKQWTVGKVLPLSNKFGFRVTLYFEHGKDVQQHGGYLGREDAERARTLLEAELEKRIYCGHHLSRGGIYGVLVGRYKTAMAEQRCL